MLWTKSIGWILLAGLLLGGFAATAGAQTLLEERLFLLPTHVETGPGTVRLDGMGGFEAVVPDENLEINSYDFSLNPAGFADDRDSWSIDLRYTHNELVQRNPRTPGTNLRLNDGILLVGYHSPGNFGMGGRIDYSEANSRDPDSRRNSYKLSGLELLLGKYLSSKLSMGVNLSSRAEEESAFSKRIYNISHDNTVNRGGLGATYRIFPGVVIGARGEIVSAQLDGKSQDEFHLDRFDWSRPGGLVSAHGFLDRGRLVAGVDYTRQEVEGEESVRISWSELYFLNPLLKTYMQDSDTFTEDRVDERWKGRLLLKLIPGRVTVGGALVTGSHTAKVIVNPNVIGSEAPQDLDLSVTAVVGGVSWTGLQDRLLLAGEVKVSSTDVTRQDGAVAVKNQQDRTLVRVGGEYLLGEKVVGRLGLIRSRESLDFSGAQELNGDFNATDLAVGIGVVPAGAIWQLDVAYDVTVDSDLNTDRSRFSAYLRYLF